MPNSEESQSEQVQESDTKRTETGGSDQEIAEFCAIVELRRKQRAQQVPPQDAKPLAATMAGVTERILNPSDEAKQRQAEAEELAKLKAEHERKMDLRRRWERVLGGRERTHGSVSLDDFQPPNQLAYKAVARLRKFAAELPQMIEFGHGLVLYGPAGSGKDHLLVSLARTALYEHDVRIEWWNGGKLSAKFRSSMNDPEPVFKSLLRPQVLYISDPLPPQGGLTAHQSECFLRMMDDRISAGKPTWVSLNVSSNDEADRLMGAPIVDRMIAGALVIHCNWPSKREPMEVLR